MDLKNKNEIASNITADIAIIGAGPSGLFSAFESGMVGYNSVIIDSLPHIGGQCTALYPEKPIYDIPAYPSILGGDLIEQLETQIKPFNPHYILGETVEQLSGSLGAFTLITNRTRIINAKAIIIAGGAGSFGPNRPPLDGIEDCEGISVFYSVRKKQDFTGKRIMIAGGGDSAVDWANALVGTADEIHLVHRRDKFRAADASLDALKKNIDNGKIQLHTPFQLNCIHAKNGQIHSIDIADLDGSVKRIDTDVLLPFFGLATSLGPIQSWGLNLNHHTITIDPRTAATSIKGIYAVGDIAHYEHKLKLILNGFAEAAQAAHSAKRDLTGDTDSHFEYSTTKGVPQHGT